MTVLLTERLPLTHTVPVRDYSPSNKMRATILPTSSSLHSALTLGLAAGHPKHSTSFKWPTSGSTILCQSFVEGQQFFSTSLNLSRAWAVSSCRKNERLHVGYLYEVVPRLVRTRAGAVAVEENVQEELQQQGKKSSDDDQRDDFAAVLEILKVEHDKFRYHKVPKFKALKLKLDPAMVLRILKHKEVLPSNKWKFFVWAKKQMRYKHTTETYNAIIVTLLEIRKFTSVYFLMEDMYKDGVSLTPETCVKMAKTFASAGMVERAIRALDHMTRLGSPASTRHLNSVVMELLKSQHHYKAYIAYREMAKTGCEPDGLTFKLLLRELGRVEKVELACKVFDDMQTRGCEPDVETASIAMGILCQCGRIDDAIELFEKVKQQGIKLNARVYNYLLNGLGETGNAENALEILEEMRSLGYTSERDSIATVVNILRDSGREEDSQKCISWVQDSRDVGNWHTRHFPGRT